jgi:CRISPR-associated protein Csx3
MANLLPAILIGGPPNAGKSVLTYNLTQALRRLNIPHYVFRANPDGDGDWFLEADRETVRQIYVKGYWSDELIRHICQDLERRHLPLLVDLGGLPTEKEGCVFHTCTHSLLLLRPDKEEATLTWHHFVSTYGLLPLAEFSSEISGETHLASREPIVTGTLSGLTRGTILHGPVFDALVERVSQIFGSYTHAELEKLHLDTAPAEPVVHLPQMLQIVAPSSPVWAPHMLKPMLAELPGHSSLSVYGRGPNWLYAALALYASEQPFYQFDARLGWVTPPHLQSTILPAAESLTMKIELIMAANVHMVKFRLLHSYLDYTQIDHISLPALPPKLGIILSGKIPFWLLTAAVRFYEKIDIPWIAVHYVPDNIGVVVSSRIVTYSVGDVVSLPT